MKDRRAFLKEAGTLTILAPLTARAVRPFQFANPATEARTWGEGREHLGWKAHFLKQGDGGGRRIIRNCEYQFLHHRAGRYVIPFGVAQMDDGEIVLVAAWHTGKTEKSERVEKPVIAFSRDGGRSWTELKRIDDSDDCYGRPMMLTYLGKGMLTFVAGFGNQVVRYFSSDYGRTWPERVPVPPASNGGPFHSEGNPLVDRDANGVATRLAEVGWNFEKGAKWPKDPQNCYLRWSSDSGRTWTNETMPKAWRRQVDYKGKSYTRGVGEGSLVRAANGWLVAALRTDLPPRYRGVPGNDNLCGTAVSISKDDGATWSPTQVLYDAGRQHAHLLRMPNGDIVMTHIMRQDIQNGRLASYRRGCEAILSHDNGLTWDMAHRYILDDFEFSDGTALSLACGHLYSALLDDGFILTCYGNYPAKGASLIRWKPTSP